VDKDRYGKTIYIKEEDIPSTDSILKNFEKSMNIGISGKYGEEFEEIFAEEVKKYINSIKDDREKVKKIFIENAKWKFDPYFDYEPIEIKNDKELEELKEKFDLIKPKEFEELSYWSLSGPIIDATFLNEQRQMEKMREKFRSTRPKRDETQADLAKIADKAKAEAEKAEEKVEKAEKAEEKAEEKEKKFKSTYTNTIPWNILKPLGITKKIPDEWKKGLENKICIYFRKKRWRQKRI
jgi:hypothetical protein